MVMNQSSARYEGVSPRSNVKTNIPSLKMTRASLATSANVTQLVRCGRITWCPSEVAPLRSGSTADAETSCL